MRKLVFSLLLVLTAIPARAEKPVSVDQIDQILAATRGKSDGKIADQLSGLQLTERVSPATLARWMAEEPGNKTREAITLLVDTSAFLNLPAAEIPSLPPPTREAQRLMLDQMVQYVRDTTTRLPNFSATRETAHFEDIPQRQEIGAFTSASTRRGGGGQTQFIPESYAFEPLHLVARYKSVVTYRDGGEVPAGEDARNKNKPTAPGLTTTGEFGNILIMVIADTHAHGVQWGHWEQGSSGQLAVFRYQVSEKDSSYVMDVPTRAGVERQHPAYNGEISIDPATGTIMRITVISMIKVQSQALEVKVLVEYAPVLIGKRAYICPVKGIASSKTSAVGPTTNVGASSPPVRTELNDVSFTDYHLFRGTARILPDTNSGTDTNPPAPSH